MYDSLQPDSNFPGAGIMVKEEHGSIAVASCFFGVWKGIQCPLCKMQTNPERLTRCRRDDLHGIWVKSNSLEAINYLKGSM